MSMKRYRTLVFDCDGVILDSNNVKSLAFYEVVREFGRDYADQLLSYHKENGGISRYQKFDYLLREILPPSPSNPTVEELASRYARLVKVGLRLCSVESSLGAMKAACPGARWLVVSGGDQLELRELFSERGLDSFFEGGVFGSPDTKEEILSRELMEKNIEKPALFLGDSKYDHIAAKTCNLDFAFISQWTEFQEWRSYCEINSLTHFESLSDILPANW